ncbi:hypothetical protein OS493_017077 [Desmophyllum pertusum]|uniref:Protein DD3-3 n=1 Tax=Desmophyllum pertusum TaxID=174260 RepID=A0A9W9YCG0_9CNID|nr:hypothetical protein OS493_017077 [Desmophyllum pertusum]
MNALNIAVLALLLCCCHADIYMHNPRGSNDRLNERSAQRKNANRLFDSQNNNRGGYNVGDKTNKAATSAKDQYNMNFFQSGTKGKSFVTFEWTNQHGSGGNDVTNPHKMNSDVVLQYMCQWVPGQNKPNGDVDTLRNGENTNTPKFTATNKKDAESEADYKKRKNGNMDTARGLHESWEWYDKCKRRERNNGLFTADQKLAGKESIYTRQNPTGTRRGYECPEERDYYPYWHPTEWKDIAVLTSDTSRCEYYKKHSFNVEAKGECVQYYPGGKVRKHWSKYNNAKDCTENGGKWMIFTNFLEKMPSQYNNEKSCQKAGSRFTWGIPHGSDKPQCLVKLEEPYCGQAPWTRDNHLGNTPDGVTPNFTWTIPAFPSGQAQLCVFRIRYNISTDDYDGWSTNATSNNKLIQQNPAIDIGATSPLKLAINTAQYGRTFQDRSHIIRLSQRLTDGVPLDKNIYNLNVRGKRGNIVQVYPAVEYDFVPNKLNIRKETDVVHIQWTGSNSHNNNSPAGDGQAGDAGEGKSGTDRNNLVETGNLLDNYPLPFEMSKLFQGAIAVWTSLELKNPKPEDMAVSLASAGYYTCLKKSKTCDAESVEAKKTKMDYLLNNAPASFGGIMLKFSNKGCFYYMCSRNNNFSNRSQKGLICIK